MTSVPILSGQLPNVRPPIGAPVDGRAAGTPAQPVAAGGPADQPSRTIETQVDAQVNGGTLTADQAASLKDFFGDGPGSGSTGSLMRTANQQLDQFDRVLDKLRASLSAGGVYGSAAGSSGLVVDRLA